MKINDTSNSPPKITAVKDYLLQLQNKLCSDLAAEDGVAKFKCDEWQHTNGEGGGLSCILVGGKIFEQAGINFSFIKGSKLPKSATEKRPELAGLPFQAMGVSMVVHPLNPFVPTMHANIRFFNVEKSNNAHEWWFGGGYDLTPYYGYVADCYHWHQTAKKACDAFDQNLYPKFKKQCDDYFYLAHRNEARGIGGIFFDDMNQWNFQQCFDFFQHIGNSIWKAYQPIVARRKLQEYSEQERNFQLYRRGRYVEFNLIYDRGTLFGLQSKGRTESILMSLPPLVSWKYNWQPEAGSAEAELYEKFLSPRDWANVLDDDEDDEHIHHSPNCCHRHE